MWTKKLCNQTTLSIDISQSSLKIQCHDLDTLQSRKKKESEEKEEDLGKKSSHYTLREKHRQENKLCTK